MIPRARRRARTSRLDTGESVFDARATPTPRTLDVSGVRERRVVVAVDDVEDAGGRARVFSVTRVSVHGADLGRGRRGVRETAGAENAPPSPPPPSTSSPWIFEDTARVAVGVIVRKHGIYRRRRLIRTSWRETRSRRFASFLRLGDGGFKRRLVVPPVIAWAVRSRREWRRSWRRATSRRRR